MQNFMISRSGDRFGEASFSVTENVVLVWMIGQTGGKKMRFQIYPDYSVDGA